VGDLSLLLVQDGAQPFDLLGGGPAGCQRREIRLDDAADSSGGYSILRKPAMIVAPAAAREGGNTKPPGISIDPSDSSPDGSRTDSGSLTMPGKASFGEAGLPA
jgi:hypothetical protein